jgi:hypothetical protein
MRRALSRVAVGVATGLAAMAGTVAFATGPASAASVAGDCATSGYAGWGVAYYSVSGGYTYWERFALEQLRAGNQTTAFVRVRHDINNSTDTIVWGPSQVHDLAHDTPKNHDPAGTIRTANSYVTYTTFQFRFDRNNATDPECVARTPSV